MILKTCLSCKFHEILNAADEGKSRCRRENCWSEFSKCIAKQALHHFLEQDRTTIPGPFSSLENVPPPRIEIKATKAFPNL